jgi:hypothetical protein
MMISRLLVHAAVATIVTSTPVLAQSRVSQESLIERTAIRAALAEAQLDVGRVRLVIDPNVAEADHAPSTTSVGRRGTLRNAYLRDAFGATIQPRANAISCIERSCELRNADAVVSLSVPTMAKDDASVTVTIEQASKKRLLYRTNRFLLKRVGGAWTVDRVEQLGIS